MVYIILMGSNFLALSDIYNLLGTHAVEDGDKALLLAFFEDLFHVSDNVLQVLILRNIDIRFDFTLLSEKLENIVIDVEQENAIVQRYPSVWNEHARHYPDLHRC